MTVLRSSATALLGLGAALIACADALAREVTVPLRFGHALVESLMIEQVFTGPQETLPAWRDGAGCNYLVLSEPAVTGAGGRLRTRSAAEARVATAIGGRCLVLLEWSGYVETDQAASLEPGAPRLRFRTVDSRLLGPDGEPAFITGAIWDWVKAYVHPRLDTLALDLGPALGEMRAILSLMLPAGDAVRTRRLLDSLVLAGVAVEADAVSLAARLDVPEAPATPAEPALTPEELARWEAAWQRWDAFLTFVVKQFARDATAQDARAALRDVLLAARYDIVEVLAAPPAGPDPVPALFVATWARLAPALRDLQTGLPGATAVRYLSFIAAADALDAVQTLGPGSGLELTADGLRRLARIVAPPGAGDPLARDLGVDPELRSLMGFGAPIAPPLAPAGPEGGAWWRELLWRRAHAASGLEPALVLQLNQWVPSARNIEGYVPLAERLLGQTAALTVTAKAIPAEHRGLFHDLLLATAWKESCWRQFVRKRGAVEPLRSSVGALGMMQVNPHAWRGFYDVEGLAGDIGYNARSGADILAHYLTHYAIRKGEHRHGVPDALARATYAVYNGGPSHLRRYRRKGTKRSLRAIDAGFYEIYRTVKAGDTRAVIGCYRG